MVKTWRWFGPTDEITLPMLRQIGVEGIVTALHHIPNGKVWSIDEIDTRKKMIESHCLQWSVVESLPVSEDIKCAGADRDKLIEQYCTSLRNLGQVGIHTVCYNFMPVIDWIRTDLNYMLPDGTRTLFFDKVRFAYFDIHILGRARAENDYSSYELAQVEKLASVITPFEKKELIQTIIVKTQGFVNDSFKGDIDKPVEIFKSLLAKYEGISKNQLRENLRYFLSRVVPVADEAGINLCIHPDDPPMAVLGLPRIVTDEVDIAWILDAVKNKRNGLTFCAGSLSAGLQNDVSALARRFASRTHFVHLRSTDVTPNGNFTEASHLEGRANLVELIRIFEAQNPELPMRVDHGKLMLGDVEKSYNPGYSFMGRMFALAQVSGMIAAVNQLEK